MWWSRITGRTSSSGSASIFFTGKNQPQDYSGEHFRFGQDGPTRAPGFDQIAQGMSGLMGVTAIRAASR